MAEPDGPLPSPARSSTGLRLLGLLLGLVGAVALTLSVLLVVGQGVRQLVGSDDQDLSVGTAFGVLLGLLLAVTLVLVLVNILLPSRRRRRRPPEDSETK